MARLLRCSFLFLVILVLPPAEGRLRGEGIYLQGAVGRPGVHIINPDKTKAGYEGVALMGRATLPVFSQGIRILAGGAVRYNDLENVRSNGQESEVANHSGQGLSLLINAGNFYFGYDYMFMTAVHHYVGAVSARTKYRYVSGHLTAGWDIPVGSLTCGLSFSMGDGVLKKKDIGLSQDSKYQEKTLWLGIGYNF